MAKKPKLSEEEQVTEYFEALNHPLKNVVQALRKIVLSADEEIAEQIKWNSPSFYYTGAMKPFDPKEYKRDIVVFNLYKNDCVLLVFPTGATINDTSGFLEGKFTDARKIAKFMTLEEANNKEMALKKVIKTWLNQVDK
ncbi:DUF1801 domain-containing protein [Arcicella lustrica]|uniref:DUF1801 domain-containing protein n=1 Tax=Arcicella lustrica TaxID=2984196 RepID=A0ABU5SLP5_9BACT|nr:DUF1801 domain-containing protein [Arcicella sp. DC25W]MEA5428183.1 DUF1801 domain-containing protein [Arcicella sp. DC25W]